MDNPEVMHNSMRNCHQSMDFSRGKSVNGDAPLIDERNEDMRIIPQLYSIAEACQILRIGHWMIYKLINENKLKTVAIGKRRLVSADSLRSFIAELEGGGNG